MAKKNDFRQKHPIKMLIYIAAVIALLACILVMVLHTRKKREEYESQITSLSQNETEYIRPERTTEAESETETEAAEEEEETKDEGAGATTMRRNPTPKKIRKKKRKKRPKKKRKRRQKKKRKKRPKKKPKKRPKRSRQTFVY